MRRLDVQIPTYDAQASARHWKALGQLYRTSLGSRTA